MMPNVRNYVQSSTPRSFFLRVVESASTRPSPLRKPEVFLYWLATTARARIVMIVVTVLLGVGLATFGDAILERTFRNKSKTEKFTSIFGARSDGERRRDVARQVLHLVIWIGGTSVIVTRLLLDAPDAVARAKNAVPSDRRGNGAGRVADRYEIGDRLGRGATGTVYRAHDVVLDRPIALKELAVAVTDEDTRERFRREAKILARLNHPGIVQVYDFIDHKGRVWIAMELVDGGDLATLLHGGETLPPVEVVHLGRQMAAALAFAHERGVVHRDLKPLNILLVDDRTPKITDFGLAKLTEGSVHTIEGAILGSPHYMSPEQADGRPVERRSDIYSLGAVFYHMLCGKPPFEGEQLASVLMQHIRRAPVAPRKIVANIPEEVEGLVLRMLAKIPDERPTDMSAVVHELNACSERATATRSRS